MKRNLMVQFLTLYLVIGVLGFFSITFVGSILIERYLLNIISRNLQLEADSISENSYLKNAIIEKQTDFLAEYLKTIVNYEDADIWILTPEKEFLVSVPEAATQAVPDQFSLEELEEDGYCIGNFFGYFPDSRLSVISAISADAQEHTAHVVIHYQMTRLYIRRSGALLITQILFVIMYLLASWLVLYYYIKVHRPLQRITTGAAAYAEGALSYRIDVTSQDEMGYLASTLNYMADILNQNGEYQKQFISNVSHDFRSPLTSIKGYVNAILDGTIPPEFQEKYLNIIASETERLEKLTKSLLALNELDIKKRTLNRTKFDIQKTIRSCAAVFEGIGSEKDIQLILHLSEKELYVSADEQQIKQILYNLIDNAIKFSNQHGLIEISTTKKAGRIFVSVKDYGCGIPKESLPKIWNRFYKTDSSRGKDRKGTGLGLSIVKEIINAHGQQIDVISTEGAGTEFIFTLEKA